MLFAPQANDAIAIGRVSYRFAEHPGLPPGSGYLYEQEGRAATVYQLRNDVGDPQALKVFRFQYRKPALYSQAEMLAPFAELPGLAVCRRLVLTAETHTDLVQTYPALEFGALMPWVEGRNWMEIVQQRESLTEAQSLKLAAAFLDTLAMLEEKHIAHGDVSGANVIIRGLDEETIALQLVDVEQIYAPSLPRPAQVLGGSPGYAHHRSGDGLWQADMDRFAGAVLMAEMLGWCDERAREAAIGETYFAEEELQQDGERLDLLRTVLAEHWGGRMVELFNRAWTSNELADCPSFSEWRAALQPADSAAPTPVSPVVGWQPIVEAFPEAAPEADALPDGDVLLAGDARAETAAMESEPETLSQPDNHKGSAPWLVGGAVVILLLLLLLLALYFGGLISVGFS